MVRETDTTPDIVLVGAGLTIDSCIEAAELLAQDGLGARVVNVLNPNALDEGFGRLVPNDKPVLTVYNGHSRVLRQTIADALLRLKVYPSLLQGMGFAVGNTGTFQEMLLWTELDGKSVYNTAKSIM